MQSGQLERGFETELEDLHAAVGDYAISNDTAEFARGNRPDYFARRSTPRTGAPRRRHLPGARPQSRNTRLVRDRCDRETGIRNSARPRSARGYQAGRHVRPAHRPPTACAASCSARAVRRCSRCGRSSTTPAPDSRRAGSRSRAPSRPRSSNAWDAFRRGRSRVSPSRTSSARACPQEVRDWVRHSPLTANLSCRAPRAAATSMVT